MPTVFKVLCIFLGMIFALWLYGFVWYAQKIPGEVKDETTITDAIVVLTGGKNRLQAGIDLLREGKAQKMFISGVHENVTFKELEEGFKNCPQNLKDKIMLGYDAQDTHENALETADWIQKEKMQSLRLVTSGYHMRRSLLEFRHVLPDIKIVPHPVFSDNVQQKKWWRFWRTALLILGEYSKYLLVNLLYFPEKLGLTKQGFAI
jgi:uncharacterized SAM-binding protein YcdF (DUF218 family)